MWIRIIRPNYPQISKHILADPLNSSTLRLLTPPMETPDPPNDTAGALKQVLFDTPWHPMEP